MDKKTETNLMLIRKLSEILGVKPDDIPRTLEKMKYNLLRKL